jgi:hypothetical protein
MLRDCFAAIGVVVSVLFSAIVRSVDAVAAKILANGRVEKWLNHSLRLLSLVSPLVKRIL